MKRDARILIVDDEAGMCDFLAFYLRGLGFEVETAFNGMEALALMEQRPFRVVLADIMMPAIDGLEMLRLVKRSTPETAVIMMTAYASLDKAMKAIQYGAVDLLIKPFELSRLLTTIEGILDNRNAPAENRAAHE